MVNIIKKYQQIDGSTSEYSFISTRSFIVAVLFGVMAYITNDGIGKMNIISIATFSVYTILMATDCITNRSYFEVNNTEFKEEPFYKKLIASNITACLTFSLHILALIIVNIILLGVDQGVKVVLHIIPLLIFGIAIGNIIFYIRSKYFNFNSEEKWESENSFKTFKIAVLAIALEVIISYICYKMGGAIFLLVSIFPYAISLKINSGRLMNQSL